MHPGGDGQVLYLNKSEVALPLKDSIYEECGLNVHTHIHSLWAITDEHVGVEF